MIRVAQARVIGGLSRGRIREVLQRSLRPRVRDCFAQARAGNPHWSGRALLVLRVQGPEVVTAHVETESEALRQCILEGVNYLAIPDVEEAAQDTTTVIYYPFVSPAYHPIPAPPLEADTRALLDTVFHAEATASPLDFLDAPE